MLGVNWFWIAADQQEPWQVNRRRPCPGAALEVVIKSALALERVFPIIKGRRGARFDFPVCPKDRS
jgi:hypothetical protein